MKLSFLYGATVGTLIHLLVKHRYTISIRCVPRFLGHLLTGAINSILAIPDMFYSDKGMPDKIVFLLGHYRCGTTHLLNLMTVDGTYVSPTTYQAVFPNSFLWSEGLLSPLLNKLGTGYRAMDNMIMRMESPQEDEIAMAALGAPTPYLVVHFPQTGTYYDSCISFENASDEHREEWKQKHTKFVCKLVRKYGRNKTLVLKSPANTARIPLLLEMYPNARFVHIHRDPYRTIQSSLHLYHTWYTMANFQSLDELRTRTTQTVLDVYEQINRRWIEDKNLIAPERLVNISFDELQRTPVETLKKIYDTFDDGSLNETSLQSYLKSIRSYEKNNYEALPAELIFRINKQLDFVFSEFGYNKIQ